MLDILKAIVSIPTPFNMVVFIVLIGSTAGVLSTIASQIRKYGCLRQEIEFKRELVDRGLSADEIEQIITVRMPKRVDADEAVACV
jgi:hypothetical protein